MRRSVVLMLCCAAAATAWAQLDDSVWPMPGANYATDRAVVQPDLAGPAGKTAWTTTADMYGNPLNPGGGAPSEGGAVVDSDGYIYYKSNGGTIAMVYKFDPVTGAVVAQADLGAGNWANRCGPVVGTDYVYVANRQTSDIKVLQKSDLSTYMTIADPNMPAQKGFRGLALGSVPNANGHLNIYGYTRDLHKMYAFDSVNGALMWAAPTPTCNSGFCIVGPCWLSEGKQVVSVMMGDGTGGNPGRAVAIRDNGDNTYTQLWISSSIGWTFGTLGALSEDASRIYYITLSRPEDQTPGLWAISTADGSVIWSVPQSEMRLNASSHVSPAVVGSRVYVGGLDHQYNGAAMIGAVDDLGATYSVAWTLGRPELIEGHVVSVSGARDTTTGDTYVYASASYATGLHRLYAVRDRGDHGELVAIKDYACPLGWIGDTNTVMADGNLIQLSSDRVVKYAPGVPPVANAGDDTSFQATSCAAGLAVLDGSGSYDPDGTLVRYLWREGETTIADVSTPTKNVKLPAGTHYLTLTAFDNDDFVSSDDVEITIVAQRLPPPVELRLDEQINYDPSLDAAFDAITAAEPSMLTFESEGIDGNVRVFVAPNEAFEGPYINLNFACYDPIDLSAPGAILRFSARYYRESGYTDAAISARLRDVNGAAGDFGVLYGPQPDPRYPAWQTITTEMLFESTDPGFDLTRVAAVEFYGTNWGGTGRDFVDVKNLYLGAGAGLTADIGGAGVVNPRGVAYFAAPLPDARPDTVRHASPALMGPMVSQRMQNPRQSAVDRPRASASVRDVRAAIATRATGSAPVAYNTSALATASAKAAAATAGAGAALPDRVGGDTCEEAVAISELPFTDSGDTCGYADDYFEACPNTEPRGPDVVYFFVPQTDLVIDISLCNSGYDTKVYVYGNTCPDPGNPVACNDDTAGCGPDGYRSRIDGLVLSAGTTYYVIVDGWSDSCGQYELTVAEHPACAIDQYLDALVEAEPDCGIGPGGDTTDGGCNSVPAVFIPLEIGAAVWGTVGTDDANRLRDTDWYVTELTTAQTVTWRVVADFDVRAFIIRENGAAAGSCDYAIVERATGAPCAQVDVTAALEPGVYYFWVGPDRFTGVPCGTTYQAELIARMGACCFVAGGCQDFMSQADCAAVPGFYRGDGSTCEEANCCEVECPEGGVLENEICGEDTNGGCNMDEPTFEPIACGIPICGTAWSDYNVRDTDWYQFSLEEESYVTLHGVAQFPLQLFIIWHNPDDPCADYVILAGASADTCREATLSSCLAPGLYSAWAGPSNWFDLPCPAQYVIELTCAQPCPTGACCFPLTEECVDGLTDTACAGEGGIYAGHGTMCADDPCLHCQPGDTLEGEPPCHDGYIDTYNGGCNSQPPVFQPIACGETICGTGGTYDWEGWGARDTDWFEVQVAEPTLLTWRLQTELPLIGFIIDGTSGCGGMVILAGVAVNPGQEGSVTAAVGPGTYWLWTGANGFWDIPCGLEYRGTLECAPYVPSGCPEAALLAQEPMQPDEPWTAYVSDRHPGEVTDMGVVLFALRHKVYDNFAGMTLPIGDIRWWGFNGFADWGGWWSNFKDPDNYVVTFYTDENGLPGDVVSEYGPVTPVKVETYRLYGGFPMYEYSATLEPLCNLSAGWVSVQGLYGGQDSVFLWMSSSAGDGYGLQQGPTGHFLPIDADLALCLAPPPSLGDLNCDGQVNLEDINPFVLILSNSTLWQATYPGCPWQNGDINGDGTVDFGDINPFIALLTG